MNNPTSTLTDRYQTTIPKIVRDALSISKGDKLIYTVIDNRVYMSVKRLNGRPDVPPPPPVKPIA